MKLTRWQFLLISTLLMLIILPSAPTRVFYELYARSGLKRSGRLKRKRKCCSTCSGQEQIVSGTPPSRGGRQYTATNHAAFSPSGFSPPRSSGPLKAPR